MFDLIQHLNFHKPAPVLPYDFSFEYDEWEYVGSSAGDDESYSPDEQRFLKGSHTKTRLASALAAMGNEGLLKTTLLWPELSKSKADGLFERFCRKAEKIDKRETEKLAKLLNKNGRPYKRGEKRIKLFSTYESFKFLTILHKVVHLCDGEAVNAGKQMMYQLNQALAQVPGVSCLGVPEFEIVSRSKMRRIRELTLAGKKNLIGSNGVFISDIRREEIEKTIEAQEFRKLSVLEGLSKVNDASLYADDSSEILVHFHGIVCAPSQAKFDEILKVLHGNPQWKIEPRQIELKSLTKKYGNKVKTVTDNFRDISDYIAKGGNDWIGKKAYLRYKLRFSNDMPLSDDEIANINWRTNELLKQDRKDQGGVEDLLSLTVKEINILTKTIDSMMKLKKKAKGHIFRYGRW